MVRLANTTGLSKVVKLSHSETNYKLVGLIAILQKLDGSILIVKVWPHRVFI